jgi:uncharacterized protein YdeI (YjbR/CyaY-like superfamily)
MSDPVFFASPLGFRAWLADHHASAAELLVGYFRAGSGRPSMSWPESVDEALCYGWIDGVRRAIDDERYSIRFTPRKARSIWSNVNLAKVDVLIAAGRMQPAGLAAWERRSPERSGIYSFEKASVAFDALMLRRFEGDDSAWRFFQSQPAGYRKLATNWVISAARPETRERRFTSLLAYSVRGERLPQYAGRPGRGRPRG